MVRATVVAAALTVALACAPSAGAATQLGQLTPPATTAFGCAAGQNTIQTFIESGQPYTVPAGGGVITAWQDRAGSITVGSGRLQVWRGTSWEPTSRSPVAARSRDSASG